MTDKIHLVTPDELTKEKQVWDAHVTREYHTEQAVKMVKVGKVMVKRPKNESFLKTHPFGDKQLPPKNVGPKHIRWEWKGVKKQDLKPTARSGQGEYHFIVVAYADNEEELLQNWTEACNIDVEEVERYEFSKRFPKPDWFKEGNE